MSFSYYTFSLPEFISIIPEFCRESTQSRKTSKLTFYNSEENQIYFLIIFKPAIKEKTLTIKLFKQTPGDAVLGPGEELLVLQRIPSNLSKSFFCGLQAAVVKATQKSYKKYSATLVFNGFPYGVSYSKEKRVLSITINKRDFFFSIPENVYLLVKELKKNEFTLFSTNKDFLIMLCSQVRSLNPVNVYTNKGIRLKGEHVELKKGKSDSF